MKRYTILLICVAIPFSIFGQVPLLEENFNYAPASALVLNGWAQQASGDSIRVTAAGLTFPKYAGSAIGNGLAVGSSGQDVTKSFGTLPTSGSLYLAAMVNVSMALSGGDYFIGFYYNNAWRGRIFIRSSGAGFQFGLGGKTATSTPVYDNTVHPLNTTHLVVLRYTFIAGAQNDSLALFVNPVIGGNAENGLILKYSDTGNDLAAPTIGVRQGDATRAPTLILDGIRVATDWATAVAAGPESALSDIIAAGNETANIDYLKAQSDSITTTALGARLWSFTIRDGGGADDADAKPTTISSLTIDKGNNNSVANWAAVLRHAALFDGNKKIASAAAITAESITFNNLSGTSVTAPDNGAKTLDLYATFKTAVQDNAQFQFRIRSAAVPNQAGSGSYSDFANFNDAVSNVAADANRIEVTASRLEFVQQPSDVAVNDFIKPPVTVSATDINGNRDFDNATKIALTAAGATLNRTPFITSAISGLATFDSLAFSTAGDAVQLTAAKTGGGWEVTSNSFRVTTGPLIAVGSVAPFGNQIVATFSAPKSYLISGANLTGEVFIFPPPNFQISLEINSGYVSNRDTLKLKPNAGSINPTTVYVRFAPDLANGNNAGMISHTSAGAAQRFVAVNGNAISVEPTTKSVMSFGAVTSVSIVVNFTGGNGAQRVLIAKANSTVNFVPVDGDSIHGTLNPDFSKAGDLGNGNKLVYDGNGTTVTITGLTAATTYHFSCYEYNVGTGTSQNYLTANAAAGNQKTAGANRYESEVFVAYQLQSDILFGQGGTKALFLDLYTPKDDTAQDRPMVIFIHGGGFKDGDKVSSFGTRVCGGLARRGYVVASINYRTVSSTATDKEHFEAMIRALQDAKASVRFFRKNARQYGIDSTQIFATGSSAGSITALHMAYLDDNEVPAYVDLASLGGSLEGASGNPGHSSKIQGVISNWGALGDFRWMKAGDAPVYCVHGIVDNTVPYDSSFSDGPFKYGSTIITKRAADLGIKTGLRLFANTGHTLDNNAAKQDSAIIDFSKWLFTILKRGNTTGVRYNAVKAPEAFALLQNYPNPFNPSTAIAYHLPRATNVSLEVYNRLGQRVAALVSGYQDAGSYQVSFEAESMASGMYFYQLRAGSFRQSKRMLLLR